MPVPFLITKLHVKYVVCSQLKYLLKRISNNIIWAEIEREFSRLLNQREFCSTFFPDNCDTEINKLFKIKKKRLLFTKKCFNSINFKNKLNGQE